MKRGSLILSLFLVSILFISGCAELGPKNISDCALIYEGVCTSSTTPTKDHMILGGVGDFGCEGDNNDPNMEVVYSRPAPGSNLKSSNSGEYCHIPIGKVENYAEEQGMTGSTGDSDENRNVCCYNMYSDPYCSSISWLNSVYNQYYSAMGGNVEPIDDFCCGNPAAQYNGIGLENTNMCWGGPSNDFYLASNTIWCENAQIGDTGIVDGITYLAVDNDMLHAMDPSIDNYVTVCTSHVTSMHTLFYNDNFNQDISRWDTSSVTDMRAMFSYSTFNRDIGNWDVSSVTDMGAMFMAAHSFNQLISSWDVSSVTNMEDMFSDAYDFNLPIGNWDTSSVTTMANMFSMSYTGVGDFNQPIGNWDTSSVTYMEWMFYDAD